MNIWILRGEKMKKKKKKKFQIDFKKCHFWLQKKPLQDIWVKFGSDLVKFPEGSLYIGGIELIIGSLP
jgi:hypothetical protein